MERRPTAQGRSFALATPHAAATEAGRAAFESGGNAVDAALAAAATLAVVYPHMCGVGGDLFALIDEPQGRTIAVNASGAMPLGLDPEAVRRAHEVMPTYGPLTITIPGAVSGWSLLAERWSRYGLAQALAPAIALAHDGVAVARSLAAGIAWDPKRLLADPGMSGVFYPNGRPLAEGAWLVQPALAETLAAIADGGASALYGGPVGERLAEGLRALGSPKTLEDLARHVPEIDSPLSGRYRDLHVSVVPPNSQGFVLLEILGAIEALGIDPDPLGPDAPILAELFHATAVDRDRHNADPRSARVPVGTLLDEGHIAGLRDAVRDGLGGSATPRPHGDTIALVAADADGWAVSLIQSLYSGFGSGILEPTTGIACHNRGSAFVLEPEHPNTLAPGKRPAHTLMPVLVHREGELAAVSGSMGGGAQPQINAMSLIRSFDLGMTASEAVSAPRWLAGGMELTAGRTVEAEARVPATVRRALEAARFAVALLGPLDEDVGHAHLIRRLPSGAFDVGSDPRADGQVAAG